MSGRPPRANYGPWADMKDMKLKAQQELQNRLYPGDRHNESSNIIKSYRACTFCPNEGGHVKDERSQQRDFSRVDDIIQCTFAPRISEASEAMTANSEPFLERLDATVSRYWERREQGDLLDDKVFTFKPTLRTAAAKSQYIGIGEDTASSKKESFIERTYRDMKEREQAQRERVAEHFARECRQVGDINTAAMPPEQRRRLREEFSQRQEEMKGRRERTRLEMDLAAMARHNATCTFQPQFFTSAETRNVSGDRRAKRNTTPAAAVNSFMARMTSDLEERKRKQKAQQRRLRRASISTLALTRRPKTAGGRRSRRSPFELSETQLMFRGLPVPPKKPPTSMVASSSTSSPSSQQQLSRTRRLKRKPYPPSQQSTQRQQLRPQSAGPLGRGRFR